MPLKSELAEAHQLAHLLDVLADDGACFFGALFAHLVELVGVGVDFVVALADWAGHLEHILGNLHLEVAVAD